MDTDRLYYDPDIAFTARKISTPSEGTTHFQEDLGDVARPLREEAALDATAVMFEAMFEVDDHLADIDRRIVEQTVNMRIPVEDEATSRAVSYISEGDHDNYISQEDWLRSLEYRSNPTSILNIAEDYDMMEMLWAQLKYRIADWLADIVNDIPVVGSRLADALKVAVSESGWEGPQADRGRLDAPLGLGQMAGTVTNTTSLTEVFHADKVIGRVKEYISRPIGLDFDASAVEFKPIVDGIGRNWEGTKGIVRELHGPLFAEGGPVTYRITPEDRTDIRTWVGREGAELFRPGLQSYRYIREQVLTDDFVGHAIYDTRDTLIGVGRVLDGYLHSRDLACCLLDNILKVSDRISGKTLRFLKALRLGLMYSFNGVAASADSLFNILIDIFNQLVTQAMGSVVTTIEEALDDWTMQLRNYISDFSKGKGEAWVRCYPFDELMQFCVSSLFDMQSDLMAYVRDYSNMMKLSYVKMDKYMAMIEKREYARRMLELTDFLVVGIESGIICKELREMESEYRPPTDEDVTRFVRNYGYRASLSADAAVKQFGSTPFTGEILEETGDLALSDLKWLQDCNKSLSDDELAEFEKGFVDMVGG